MTPAKPKKKTTPVAGDPRLVDRVRRALSGTPELTERRMFGGTGFMVGGHLCVTARPARIMCRIDPAMHDRAVERAGCRTVVMRGREYRGYVHIDADAVKTQAALKRWIASALAFNATLPGARKRKQASTPEAELESYIARSSPKEQKVIRAIRSALRKRLPTANELAYDYGKFFVITYSPTEQGMEGVLTFAARPDGLRLYLANGPKLPDPEKLLESTGGQTRYIALTAASDLSTAPVKALIAAALAQAKIPMPLNTQGTLFIRGRGAR